MPIPACPAQLSSLNVALGCSGGEETQYLGRKGLEEAEWGDTSCSLGSSTSSPSTQHRDLSCPLLHQQVLSPPAPASLRALTLVICACFSWVVLEQDVCGRLIIHCCQSRTSTSTTACVYITLYELAPLKESEIALFQLF